MLFETFIFIVNPGLSPVLVSILIYSRSDGDKVGSDV